MAEITLRHRTEADEPFLFLLYASTRQQEMELVPWPEEFKRNFLQSQYALQKRHYDSHYAGAAFQVVERDGEPIGRIYTWHGPSESVLIDIALLPAWRGQGIGRPLIERFLAEAAGPVILHVEPLNPARRLYERLGFAATGDGNGPYVRMSWTRD